MIKKRKKMKGVLTLDFIFSVMAIYTISMVFAVMAFTLMMSSVVQYITFATNRTHISGHVGQVKQFEVAETKFANLVSQMNPIVKQNSTGWFQAELQGPIGPEDFSPPDGVHKKYGYTVRFTTNVLKNARLPLLGSPSDGAEDDNFGSANLNAYLYREPTTDECLQFNRRRWERILSLFPDLSSMGGVNGSDPHGASADNGC